MTALASDQRTGRCLVSEELFGSLTNFVVTHNGQTPERAECIADQAVAFLATVATANVLMIPSDDVDTCGRPYGAHGGDDEDDGGEPNPPTGDSDDGRDYYS